MNSNRIKKIVGTVAATAAVSGAYGVVPSGVAVAATTVVHVTNHADDGSPTSLRGTIDAINAAGGDWKVVLEPGFPYVVNRDCQDGDPDDNHGGDLDVMAGDVEFTTQPFAPAVIWVVCAGERAFDKFGGATTIAFDTVRITGGNTANGAGGDQFGDRDGLDANGGGAIRSQGSVKLLHTEIDGNRTGRGGNGAPGFFASPGGDGGDGGEGGAVWADDWIEVDWSRIHDNTTGAGGAGANGSGANNDGGRGGRGGEGTLLASLISVQHSIISDNALGDGGFGGAGLGVGAEGGDGGFGGRGGAGYAPTITITGSTVTRNASGAGGDGGDGNGARGGDAGNGGSAGGFKGSNLTMLNSTVHGNATGGGGLGGDGAPDGNDGFAGAGGGLYLDGASAITFSTITGNAGRTSANLYASDLTPVVASVIGEATAGESNCDGDGADPIGYTVVDDGSCGATPDEIVPALGLGPLRDNGGPTPTRLPSFDSLLAGRIPDDVCPNLSPSDFDQRFEDRPNWRCEPGAVELPIPSASKFVPLTPTRVFDTREPGPATGYVVADATRSVQFGGVAGIPTDGVTAVAFNLTITESGGAGFVTAYPHGDPVPVASNLNTVRSGQTVPNLVIVPLGDGGRVDFYTLTGGHLLADVVGYFQQAEVASDGRIRMLDPQRVFDTREPGPLNGKVNAGETLTLDVTGSAGIPGSEVAAVILNVTATEADAAGYVTAFGGGQPVPLASTLNLVEAGTTTSNLAIVPVAPDGTVSFFTSHGAHLLADVMGYVTDATAPVETDGLFVPVDPYRVFDTRNDQGPPLAAGTTIEREMTAAIADRSAGIWVNLTGTQVGGPSYVTGWRTGEMRPVASNLNVTFAGETRANSALLPHDPSGTTSYFTLESAHLLTDAYGYVLASPPVV